MLSTTGTSSTHLRRSSSLHANFGFILRVKMKSYHLLNLLAKVRRKAHQRKIRQVSKSADSSIIKSTSSPPPSWPRLIRQLLMDRSLRWHGQLEVFTLFGARSFPPLREGRIGDGRPSAQRMLTDLHRTPPIVITHPSSSPRKSLTTKVNSVPITPL